PATFSNDDIAELAPVMPCVSSTRPAGPATAFNDVSSPWKIDARAMLRVPASPMSILNRANWIRDSWNRIVADSTADDSFGNAYAAMPTSTANMSNPCGIDARTLITSSRPLAPVTIAGIRSVDGLSKVDRGLLNLRQLDVEVL